MKARDLALDDGELSFLGRMPETTLRKVADMKRIFGEKSRVVDYIKPPEPRDHLLDAALERHRGGRPVIAVTKDKKPYREGWNRYFTERQTEAEIRKEFSNGAYGIAQVLYPASEHIHLDFDGPHADAAWEQTGISLPETAKNFTQSGCQHLVFTASRLFKESKFSRKIRLVKAACDCTKDGKPHPCGVDLLFNGYAVIPPTPGYREDPDHPLEDAVEIPDAIVRLALAKQTSEKRANGASKKEGEKIFEGERKATLVSLAGSMRARGMAVESIRAALRAENENRCDSPLEDDEIQDIIKSVTKWQAGTVAESEHLTDLGNARRFARQHRDKIRYSFEREQWLVDTGKRWEWDNSGEAAKLAKQTIISIYQEAANESDPDRRVALAKHAARSENDARIRAMLNQAKSEEGIPVLLRDLNRHPMLFNCQNGVVDLKSGELKHHDPALLITQISPVEFDPQARCDLFLSFLDEIMKGRVVLVEFLQKYLGYCLTAEVIEQIIAFFYGCGANGKSTAINLLMYIMGDYATMAAPGLLLAKRNEQHPTELADLVGKRFVATVEVQEGKKLNESLFKWLSGGDMVKGRFMRENFFQFEPTFKLAVAANHRPAVTDNSHAFWRRMRTIPFDVQIPLERQDTQLLEKLKAEAPGILVWLVRGTIRWKKDGLEEPDEIANATEDYRQEQDFLGPFLEECCEVGPDLRESSSSLYERFKKWAEAAGEKVISAKRLTQMLKQRGFENKKDREGRMQWQGLGVK